MMTPARRRRRQSLWKPRTKGRWRRQRPSAGRRRVCTPMVDLVVVGLRTRRQGRRRGTDFLPQRRPRNRSCFLLRPRRPGRHIDASTIATARYTRHILFPVVLVVVVRLVFLSPVSRTCSSLPPTILLLSRHAGLQRRIRIIRRVLRRRPALAPKVVVRFARRRPHWQPTGPRL
jgi:hypothetical protein